MPGCGDRRQMGGCLGMGCGAAGGEGEPWGAQGDAAGDGQSAIILSVVMLS